MTAASPGRSGLALVSLTAGLILTATFTVVNHHAWSRVRQEGSPNAVLDAKVEARIGAVETQISKTNHHADAVSEQTFAKERELLDARILQVENSVKYAAASADVERLMDRVKAVETRVALVTRPAMPSPSQKVLPATGAPPSQPPFTVIGMELRGGERFVAIAPVGTTSLSQIRLLRIGDSEGPWLLESFDANSVQFRVAGRPQQLPIP